MVLTPAPLFRILSTVHVERLSFTPVAMYFVAALPLAASFSNTVMIGIALVSLVCGHAGVVTLLMLIPVHSLVLPMTTTVVPKMVTACEERVAGQGGQRHMALMVLAAVRGGIIQPVPLPILIGMLFAQNRPVLPQVVDSPL